MDFNINLKRLKRINKLVGLRQTGNPKTFAEQLNISQATLYRYLKVMRIFGAPIEYDKSRQTYYYEKPGEMNLRFEEKTDSPLVSEDSQVFFFES